MRNSLKPSTTIYDIDSMNTETAHSEYYGRGGNVGGGSGGRGRGFGRGRGARYEGSERHGESYYNPFRSSGGEGGSGGGGRGGGGYGQGRGRGDGGRRRQGGMHHSASYTSVASATSGASASPLPDTPVASGAGAAGLVFGEGGVSSPSPSSGVVYDEYTKTNAGVESETAVASASASTPYTTPSTEVALPPLYDGPTTFEAWDDEVLSMDDKILRGIYSYGFDKPSPIQRLSIIPIKYGRDIIAQAQSGTGKTGAFSLGTLSRVDVTQPVTQAIILAPTRELSEQIHYVISSLGQYLAPKTALLIGGTSTADDSQRLRFETPHIVVGCPGRINDMLKRGALSAEYLKLVVLDEADEMLSHGFSEQIYHIVRQIPKTTQIALFSATFPPELEPLTQKFMREPLKMLVERETISLAGILQYRVNVASDSQKYLVMKDIFSIIAMSQCIIYCNSVPRVESLTQAMVEDGFPVIAIHSNMTTKERQNIIEEFKRGKHRVLVSSDVTARGLDVQQVSVVVNFDLPRNKHTYLHRIGRCGRWGRKGMAINFISGRDEGSLREIETWYKIKVEELPTNFGSNIRKE